MLIVETNYLTVVHYIRAEVQRTEVMFVSCLKSTPTDTVFALQSQEDQSTHGKPGLVGWHVAGYRLDQRMIVDRRVGLEDGRSRVTHRQWQAAVWRHLTLLTTLEACLSVCLSARR